MNHPVAVTQGQQFITFVSPLHSILPFPPWIILRQIKNISSYAFQDVFLKDKKGSFRFKKTPPQYLRN